MSDFFTNLVARSFGSAPVIRPRVTSLFEPVHDEAGRFANAFGNRNEEMTESQEHELVAQEAEDRHAQRLVPISTKFEGHETTDPASEAPVPVVARRRPQFVLEPEQARIADSPLDKHEPKIPFRPSRPRDADDLPAQRELSRDPVATVKTYAEVPMASPVRPQVSEKKESGQLLPPKLAPELRIRELALSAKSERQNRREQGNDVGRNSQAAEPSVQVTIGRIEVRATKEDTHLRRPNTASPVMKLEEYLRQRTQRVGR